jgi:hypothetical protein
VASNSNNLKTATTKQPNHTKANPKMLDFTDPIVATQIFAAYTSVAVTGLVLDPKSTFHLINFIIKTVGLPLQAFPEDWIVGSSEEMYVNFVGVLASTIMCFYFVNRNDVAFTRNTIWTRLYFASIAALFVLLKKLPSAVMLFVVSDAGTALLTMYLFQKREGGKKSKRG